jgi:YHS domain-containing protein
MAKASGWWGLAIVFAAAGLLFADDQATGTKNAATKTEVVAKCPITGEKITKDAAIDYKGGKLYFCCPGCIAPFKEKTAKYEAKANEQLVITGQAKQIACPVTGAKSLNPSTKTKVCGVDVCFCCKGCQGKVKAATAEKQREMIFGKGFDKGFAVNVDKEKTKPN